MLYHVMWKPIQHAMLQKADLVKVGEYEVDEIYRVMARHVAEINDIDVRSGG